MNRLEQLEGFLSRRGLASGSEIQKELGISQPVMSRLVREVGPRVSQFGRSVATRYGLSREIAGLGRQVPVFRIDEAGTPHRHAILHLLVADRCLLERVGGEIELFEGLPPFAEDMRPQGFIGRSFPASHPELGLPPRINDWNDHHRLIALARRGDDCVGNLIIGEESLDRFLGGSSDSFSRADFPAIAARSLAVQPGSSAGGEHPKFAVESSGRQVIVKFAGGDGSAAERWRDLLICEHIALQVLRESGFAVPESSWFDAEGYRFLELERFDRVNGRGRRGIISLYAVNCYFLGHDFDSWSRASQRILSDPVLQLTPEHARQMIWLDTFGDLIGNTDRHFGNFSFFTAERRRLELRPTPVYDMLPMLFAPKETSIVQRPFAPQSPNSLNFGIWSEVASQARLFWARLIQTEQLSQEFRKISEACLTTLEKLIDFY